MRIFDNYYAAQHEAKELAERETLGDYMPLWMQVEIARRNGDQWTPSQVETARVIFDQSVKQRARIILQGFINDGRVKDCQLSRRFMAGLK